MIKNFRSTFPVWNYVKLLADLGPDRKIQQFIADMGFRPPPIKTIAGWRQRNSIPGRWAPLMIQIGIERWLIKDIKDLRRTPRQKFRKALEEVAAKRRFKPEWAEL